MVDPIIALGVAAAAGVAIAAGYSYLTGEDATAGVDLDQDGEDDVSYTFEGADGAETPDENPREFDVAPEDVQAISSALEEITGIGATRKDDLQKAGFHTASDLYFAADEELKEVNGIGDLTVSQIRSDIGSVDEDPNGQSAEADTQSSTSAETDDETSSSNDEQ